MGGYTELLEKLGLTKREGLEHVLRTLRDELEVTGSALSGGSAGSDRIEGEGAGDVG